MSKASIALRGSACIWRRLPMDDLEENAAIVNALQRRADVVVQKSIAEGFGLRSPNRCGRRARSWPSRIGGIQDQIVDGISGILLDNPTELGPYGDAVAALLDDPARAEAIGREAKERVRQKVPRHAHPHTVHRTLRTTHPASAERRRSLNE